MFVARSDRAALLSSVAALPAMPVKVAPQVVVPMGVHHATMKAIGAHAAPAKPAKPHLYKLSDEQVAKVLGKNSDLAKNVNLYHVRTGETSLKKAFEVAIEQIGQQQAGDPDSSISLNVDKLEKATKDAVVKQLMKGEDAEQGDNNQTYSAKEIAALMHYLEAVSGPGAQLYMARWDDISSEYIGTMVAVQNPTTKELTLAQVIGFRP